MFQSGLEGFTDPEWEDIKKALKNFEDTWQSGGRPPDIGSLTDYLPGREASHRPYVLASLIEVDMGKRWGRGEGVRLEEYFTRLPELNRVRDLLPQLMVKEYRVRRRHGDAVAEADYRDRYPMQYDDFRRLNNLDSVGDRAAAASRADTGDGPMGSIGFGAASRADTRPQGRPAEPSGPIDLPDGYRLMNHLGGGAFGQVWRAEAPGGVACAVKVIPRQFKGAGKIDSARKETQAMELIKNIPHNYLLGVRSYWAYDDKLVIAMDLADRSLRDLAEDYERADKRPPAAELAKYVAETAEAIDHMHKQRIQHRDIKPENVLLLGDHVKVADFGLAEILTDGSEKASQSGTPYYMAPEVWEGKAHINTDQYSLALTYAELRLGRRIFDGQTHVDLMLAHMQDAPPLDELDPAEAAVVGRALAKNPVERYLSCTEFAKALDEAVNPRPALGRRLPKWAVALTCLLLAAAAGVLAWALRPPEPWLPTVPGAAVARAGDAELIDTPDAGRLWDKITVRRGGQDIELLLVPRTEGANESSFYVMKNEVSNGLFGAAWDDPAFRAELGALEREYAGKNIAVKHGDWREPFAGIRAADHPDWPALKVGVLEAYAFARWVGGGTGHLPTPDQWDRAAGSGQTDSPYQDAEPAADPAGVNVNRERGAGPLDIGTDARDVSPFLCRDMGGNAQEWTRGLEGKETGGILRAKPDSRVLLRGAAWFDPSPYKFGDEYTVEESLPVGETKYSVGFRVVIETR